ncbi:MAG: endonuclease III [Verrucomicrobia bacterium]|nr:endonuclease III [Verrucomicrobiota bacterium]
MTRKEKAFLVKAVLDNLFPNPPIPLHYTNHYTLLIAVLLSAQCTDERVNKITKHLFAKTSTPEEMILISIEEIESIIKPCGLYKNKAKAISSLSRILIDKFQGKVPPSLESLESLPGVGHKTASVVLAQGFSIPAFPVDTHIHRCAKRWGLSKGKNVDQTEKDLKKLFPKNTWNLLHLQIIYYARAYCPAKGHNLETCPICQKLN